MISSWALLAIGQDDVFTEKWHQGFADATTQTTAMSSLFLIQVWAKEFPTVIDLATFVKLFVGRFLDSNNVQTHMIKNQMLTLWRSDLFKINLPDISLPPHQARRRVCTKKKDVFLLSSVVLSLISLQFWFTQVQLFKKNSLPFLHEASPVGRRVQTGKILKIRAVQLKMLCCWITLQPQCFISTVCHLLHNYIIKEIMAFMILTFFYFLFMTLKWCKHPLIHLVSLKAIYTSWAV